MKTFLGIPLSWKVKNDSEYVDLVRRMLRANRWMAWFGLTCSLACFVFGFGVPFFLLHILVAGPPVLEASSGEVVCGFSLGFFLAALGGVFVFLGITQLGLAISFFKGHQTEKLLVKYFDLATSKGANHAF